VQKDTSFQLEALANHPSERDACQVVTDLVSDSGSPDICVEVSEAASALHPISNPAPSLRGWVY
jgi:hypothetical protein